MKNGPTMTILSKKIMSRPIIDIDSKTNATSTEVRFVVYLVRYERRHVLRAAETESNSNCFINKSVINNN